MQYCGCTMVRKKCDIYRDLKVHTITDEIKRVADKYERRLHQHENIEVLQLFDNAGLVRRLQGQKPFELVNYKRCV